MFFSPSADPFSPDLSLSDLGCRADPAGASHKLALLRPCRHAVVGQQVKYALQSFRLE
jgi:hypothetical protein